jgi:hypothetical protein
MFSISGTQCRWQKWTRRCDATSSASCMDATFPMQQQQQQLGLVALSSVWACPTSTERCWSTFTSIEDNLIPACLYMRELRLTFIVKIMIRKIFRHLLLFFILGDLVVRKLIILLNHFVYYRAHDKPPAWILIKLFEMNYLKWMAALLFPVGLATFVTKTIWIMFVYN